MEGRRHIDTQGNGVGCDIGKMIRDEVALDMLRQSVAALDMDRQWITDNVTALATGAILVEEQGSVDSAEKLTHEMEQLLKKKEDVLDSFFSKNITTEEMRMMTERYDKQMSGLQARLDAVQEKEKLCKETNQLTENVRREVCAILSGETDSEVFYKSILDQMIVYQDSRVEVQRNLLPLQLIFIQERLSYLKDEYPDLTGQTRNKCAYCF